MIRLKVGEFVIYKTKSQQTFNDGTKKTLIFHSYGIIDSIHNIENTAGLDEYYVINSVNIKREDIVSTILTESV